jgi:hypothetical protein
MVRERESKARCGGVLKATRVASALWKAHAGYKIIVTTFTIGLVV